MGTPIGKVLITPRGTYASNISYDVLDLVSHNGKAWLCSKPCTGIEPVEGEYWQIALEVSAESIQGLAEFVDSRIEAHTQT